MAEVLPLSKAFALPREAMCTAAPWAGALREQGRAGFTARGLPTRRIEAWKYSDLDRALNERGPEARTTQALPSLPGARIVSFENGRLETGLSDFSPDGFYPLNSVLADQTSPFGNVIGHVNPQDGHAILDLNAAQMEEGFVFFVPKGETPGAPLHVRFNWSDGTAGAPEGKHIRIVIVLEEDAAATLVESHVGSPGFATVVTELQLAPSAHLKHIRLEQLSAAGRQTAVTLGDLATSAQYRGFYLSEGGHFARHEALLKLSGEGAVAEIDGAYLAAETRHCDNTTVISHAAPMTTSRQAFRGVLSGESRGVYQGCVKVAPEAQGTDARQMSRALLLSHKATIATKPELEIFADDVKCSHGATAGELDAAALFFLRARGIPEAEARRLLVNAFLVEALETIHSEPLRATADAAVADWLALHAGEVARVE